MGGGDLCLQAEGQRFPVMWSSLRAWSVSDAHTAPPTVAQPAFLPLCRTLNSSTHLAVFAECHAPRLSVFCPSPFSLWPFLFWFPSCPEHTMATPLEDVGKQVGRSHPLPVAPKGLPGASRPLSFLSVSPPGVAGCPAPGRLYSVPTGRLPGPHCAGARGGHGAGQHHRSHRGTHRLLYR